MCYGIENAGGMSCERTLGLHCRAARKIESYGGDIRELVNNLFYERIAAYKNCRKVKDEPFPWSLDIGKAQAHHPYWYAFWETSHTSGYGADDFIKVNSVLFPRGTEELEVYEWSTEWLNYFDEAHEWWGTACWSIYDKYMNRYVVIMAPTTD